MSLDRAADHRGRRRRLGGVLAELRAAVDALSPTALLAAALAVALAVVVSCGVLVAEVVDEVLHDGPDDTGPRPDDRIMAWVIDRRRPVLTTSFRLATRLGDGWFITLVVIAAAVVLVRRRRPALAVAVALATGGTALVTTIVKDVVGRDRPELLSRLVDASGGALPSGHSSMSIACYGAIGVTIALCASRTATRVGGLAVACLLPLVVGASRVYLGVHWPSDVVTGWLVGLAWLAAVGVVSWALWRIDRPRRWWGP